MLVRDPVAVLATLQIAADKSVICTQNCTIQVPMRYMDIGLGSIGESTQIYGCFALILENEKYSVCNINALVEIIPFKTLKLKTDEMDYYVFHFNAGDTVFKTTTLVKRDSILYSVINEFMFMSKIPWYMEYEDIGKLFDTAKYHAGSNLGQNSELLEFFTSIIGRFKNDRRKYIRTEIRDYKDINPNTTDFVPMTSLFYSNSSTVNKLAGSYFNDGVVSSLVNKSTKANKIETLLKN